jgi:hypothetical protein
MSTIFDELSEVINSAAESCNSPTPIEWQGATGRDLPRISPWDIWPLFGLIRFALKQQWATDIRAERLGDVEASIAEYLEQGGGDAWLFSGVVPGLLEWEYRFTLDDFRLQNRLTGERIQHDYYVEHPPGTYNYVRYLKSLGNPPFIERRIKALHPRLKTVGLSISELRRIGLLEEMPKCREWSQQIEQINAACETPSRCIAIGEALGDWFLVEQHLPDDDSVARLCRRSVDRRARRLLRLVKKKPGWRGTALNALDVLPGIDIREALKIAFQKSAGTDLMSVVELVSDRDDEDWSAEIVQVFDRIEPTGDYMPMGCLLSCAEYLLRRNRCVEKAQKTLAGFKDSLVGDAAILALEFSLDCALNLFRRGLRAPHQYDRVMTAAALVILNRPWGWSELVRALRESNDHLATIECRVALYLSPHAEHHRIVEEWDQRNPPKAAGDIRMTAEDEGYLKPTIEELYDRVYPLRNREVVEAALS